MNMPLLNRIDIYGLTADVLALDTSIPRYAKQTRYANGSFIHRNIGTFEFHIYTAPDYHSITVQERASIYDEWNIVLRLKIPKYEDSHKYK